MFSLRAFLIVAFTILLQTYHQSAAAVAPISYPLSARPVVPPRDIDTDPVMRHALDDFFGEGFGNGFRNHFLRLVQFVRRQKIEFPNFVEDHDPIIEIGVKTFMTYLSQHIDGRTGKEPAHQTRTMQVLEELSATKNRKLDTFYDNYFPNNKTSELHKSLIKARGMKFAEAGITDTFTALNVAEQVIGKSLLDPDGFNNCLRGPYEEGSTSIYPDRAVANILFLLSSVHEIDARDPIVFEEDAALVLLTTYQNIKGVKKEEAYHAICKVLRGKNSTTQGNSCPKILDLSQQACDAALHKMPI